MAKSTEGGGQKGRSLLGVYQDEQAAKEAAERAERAGAPKDSVAIGRREDEVISMQAEMQEEMDQSWVSPQAGFAYTKESAKGLAVLMPLLAVVGAVLALPLGLVISVGDLPLWLRLLIAAGVGATAGATVALVAGPALGSKNTAEPVAAQRGAVVRVDDDSPEVVRAMAEAEPLRLDEVGQGNDIRAATVTTEEDRSDDGVVEGMTRNLNADDR